MQLKGFIESINFTRRERLLSIPYNIIKKAFSELNLEFTIIKKSNAAQLYYFSKSKSDIDFLAYCLANHSNLVFDLGLFEDKEDKKEILKFIKNRIYGTLCDSVDRDIIFDQADLVYEKYYKQMKQELEKKDQHYILNWNGSRYILPVNNFDFIIFYHKYGIPLLPDNVRRTLAGKDVIDAGAFIGDSALILKELNPKKIYAFEPLEENIKLLKKTIELNNFSNVVILDKALSSREETLTIQPAGPGSFIYKLGSQKIDTTTIDKFVDKYELAVGLIKMDIEGYEFEAIKGAEKTIRDHKPVQIISLYHDGRSFFEIPKLLNKWVPEYKFRFLNLNKTNPASERVLLAYYEGSD